MKRFTVQAHQGGAWPIQPCQGTRISVGLGHGLPCPSPFPCRPPMVGRPRSAEVSPSRCRLPPPPPHRDAPLPGGPAPPREPSSPRRRKPAPWAGGSPGGWSATSAATCAAASSPTDSRGCVAGGAHASRCGFRSLRQDPRQAAEAGESSREGPSMPRGSSDCCRPPFNRTMVRERR
jgi:hypothetical protein